MKPSYKKIEYFGNIVPVHILVNILIKIGHFHGVTNLRRY